MSRLKYLRTIGRGELTMPRLRDALLRRIRELPHRLAWELPSPEARASWAALRAVKDKHAGQRCVVVANGPSIREMDLRVLSSTVTIGMNRIYRLPGTFGFVPNYLVVIDVDTQLEQIADELRTVSIPKFLNWNARRLLSAVPNVTYVKPTFRPRFSTNLLRGVWGGHSVTYVCLQLAYWMGFKEVVLIGKDHDYQERGVPGHVLVASGGEVNHALPNYYATGQTWRLPDYKGEELAYRMARHAFERDGRRIVDATVNGRLTVFEKADFSSLF